MTPAPTRVCPTDDHGDAEDDMTSAAPPQHTYPEPELPVVVSSRLVASTIETLHRFEAFFRHHASPTVHAELRTFVTTQGWDAACGPDALLDDLGLDRLALHWALDPTTANPITQQPPTPPRDDPATTTCPVCQTQFTPTGRQQYCGAPCRKTAFRRRHQDPPTTVVVPAARPRRQVTIYECPTCGERLLGEQRCQPCGTFTHRVGIGGPCPHCDEPVPLADLLDQEVTIMPNR